MEDCKLSVRTRAAMRELGISDLYEFARYTREEILAIRNVGETTCREIEVHLARCHTLTLRGRCMASVDTLRPKTLLMFMHVLVSDVPLWEFLTEASKKKVVAKIQGLAADVCSELF